MNAAVPASRRDSDKQSLVVRFAGDSGDGIQLTGRQYTLETALQGSDLATFPDFPAEIRAPAGTLFGVSAFQIHFGSERIRTAGDDVDMLVALNPAALKTNLADLRRGGVIIADSGTFVKKNLQKADYEVSPLEDNSLDGYQVVALDISKLTQEAVKHCDVSNRESLRARNLWTLGLVLWLTGRERQTTVEWLTIKFAKTPAIMEANLAALNAGHAFGETAELPRDLAELSAGFTQAPLASGEYRNINGTEGICWGLLAGTQLANLSMVYCSYPITPASNMLHVLARLPQYGVTTFQAEDEIAAICAALGASYAGSLGVTGSSGPGLALKTEAMGLAIATELPLVIVNAQRGGPSTGLPTKTEQSDLFQAVWGRNADSPLVVVAARSAGDCFDCAIEAVRLATRYMTPVILLTDGYLSNVSEPWRIPSFSELTPFPVEFHNNADENFAPYQRDGETLARPWVAPGTPGLAHRIGGIERADISGNISYDPANHQHMTELRQQKIRNIASDIPEQTMELGDDHGDLLVVGWGSTYGALYSAVENVRREDLKVSFTHLRYLSPLPRNLGDLLQRFEKILVPEMNTGQLLTLLRAEYCVPAEGLNKVAGQPFKVHEVEQAIRNTLQEASA